MHLILMGPQGSGKGTQAGRLAPRLGLVLVATGDLFRRAIAAETALGHQIKAAYDRGELISDDLTVALVEEKLDELSAERALGTGVAGALYDGFPRTRLQADALDAALTRREEAISTVIQIDVPRQTLVNRLAGRRVCTICDTVYHIEFNPPREEGVCDRCGGEVRQRPDDTPAAIEKRLDLYELETAPLLAHYRDRGLMAVVNGVQAIDLVTRDIERAVKGTATTR
ncbi:MAG: adenylate kinase [Chloroflexia bacterium]|nr:adenylate kinase [Chloroflexia bacterium]